MKIDDIRVSRASNGGGSAEVILRADDGAEVRIGLALGAASGDSRAAILHEARDLAMAAADALGMATGLPGTGTVEEEGEHVPLESLELGNTGRPRESLEEEDDNPYQDSDDALPDERVENALGHGLTRGRFGDPA